MMGLITKLQKHPPGDLDQWWWGCPNLAKNNTEEFDVNDEMNNMTKQ